MTQSPKRTLLAFGEDSLDTYKRLGKALGITNRSLFLIAMAWGSGSGLWSEDFKRSNTGPRLEYLKPEDDALMAAVQLAHTGSVESLQDIEQRHTLAEQYAEAGIRLLKEMLDDRGDFSRAFAGEIRSRLIALGDRS